jgi:hypothetical protein
MGPMATTIKSRYRRHASICYEVAATMNGSKTAEMVRLANVYSDLADALGVDSPECARVDREEASPHCPQCRSAMKRIHVLPETELFPVREEFSCEKCGETLICRKS